MTIKCNTVTQHWAASLPRWATRLSRASSIGVNCRWLAHTHSLSHSHTLAHTHSPTKGPYMRSPEYNPVGTHLPSTRPPDGRYRRSVVEERGEARAARSSAGAVVVFWGEPPNRDKHGTRVSPLPTHGSQFWQEQSNFTQQVRTRAHRPQLPNLTPAQRRDSTRPANPGTGP